jgi:hypothetical protein
MIQKIIAQRLAYHNANQRKQEKQRLAKSENTKENMVTNELLPSNYPVTEEQSAKTALPLIPLIPLIPKNLKGHTSESVDSDLSTPPAEDKKKSPPCPYQKILEIYHEVLPELPGVRVLTDARERTIRSLWLHQPDLEWWRDYFQDVRRSDFLMGRSNPGPGRTKPFMADLEWLVKPGNFAKVYEGRYHS